MRLHTPTLIQSNRDGDTYESWRDRLDLAENRKPRASLVLFCAVAAVGAAMLLTRVLF